MNDRNIDRDFGKMEGRLDSLEKQHHELRSSIDKRLTDIEDKLQGMTDLLQQSIGASKIVRWVVGFFAAVGGVIAWYFEVWK